MMTHSKKWWWAACGVVALGAIGLISSGDLRESAKTGLELAADTVVPVAYADGADRRQTRRIARRTSRRTARRVERRHDYYDSLPGGCVSVVLAGIGYWNCGGLYYQEVIQDGAQVYIIVTP
ncbi:MAG: hypothetical protein ACPGOY_01650 [Rhodospirillaceae bacterium]